MITEKESVEFLFYFILFYFYFLMLLLLILMPFHYLFQPSLSLNVVYVMFYYV